MRKLLAVLFCSQLAMAVDPGPLFNSVINSSDGSRQAEVTSNGVHANLRNSSGTEIGTLSTPLRVDPTGTTTQPISGTVSATQSGTWNINNVSGTVSLPTGASTSALQTTGNSSLSSIDTKTPSLGQATMAASSPVVISSNQSAIPASQSGTWTVQPGNTANTTPWLTTINQGGNSASVSAANALKVDGSAVTQPVSGTVTANQGGTWNVNNVSGTVSLPTGASTSALQTTGNASLASIDAGVPTALGQTTMAASMPVTIASNQSQVPVSGTLSISNPNLATFTATAQNVAIGNNKSMLSLLNAGGSPVVIKLRDLKIKNVQTVAVTGVAAIFSLFRFTGHSAGTVITPETFDSTDSVNGSVTARTGGTIAGESANSLFRWLWSSDEWGVGALDQEGYEHGIQNWAGLLPAPNFTKPITLNAGQGIHIKQQTNSTAGTFDLELVFTQE